MPIFWYIIIAKNLKGREKILLKYLIIIISLAISASQAAEQSARKESEIIKDNSTVIKNFILETKAHLDWLEEQKDKVPKSTIQKYIDQLADLMKLDNQAKGDPTMDAEAELLWFVLMHSPAGNFYN
ncbi:MAG: hypothetical protein K2Y18_02325 [Alphaproteobacteria bacterium]|nr:hypothetical protein [Alphaproteobacteria bacterium]